MPRENLPETATKTVLVTGATRGLGLAISTRLISEGYRVVGVARRETPEFTRLTTLSDNVQAHFVSCDLEQTEGLHELVRQIVKAHGRLYALVNNAGIGLDGVLATMHARDVERGAAHQPACAHPFDQVRRAFDAAAGSRADRQRFVDHRAHRIQRPIGLRSQQSRVGGIEPVAGARAGTARESRSTAWPPGTWKRR